MEISADIFNKYALGVVAVISMIVGPLVQWRIARRQTEIQTAIASRQVADSIASKRLTWIAEIRTDLAAVISEYTTYFELHYLIANHPGTAEKQWERFMEMKDAVKHAATLIIAVDLRLSGSNPDHNKLLHSLYSMRDFVAKHGPSNEVLDEGVIATWNDFRRQVLENGKKLLNDEWDRVRRGEV